MPKNILFVDFYDINIFITNLSVNLIPNNIQSTYNTWSHEMIDV